MAYDYAADSRRKRIEDLEAIASEFERRAANLRRMANNIRDGLPTAHGIGGT